MLHLGPDDTDLIAELYDVIGKRVPGRQRDHYSGRIATVWV